jgi:DNA ligase-1
MQETFRALAELCDQLEGTSKRLRMIDLVANFLKSLPADEVEPATAMILGRPFPKWDQRTLEVSWATLSNVIKRITKTDWSAFSAAFSKTGDVGAATKVVFEKSTLHKQATLFGKPLTILDVRQRLEDIAAATGQGSREKKERLLETLLSNATSLEAKYLVKILLGEMRTGFSEGLTELAVSKAFNIPHDVVRRASMLTGDIGEVAEIAKTKGTEAVAQLQLQVFRPIKPMLAQMADDVSDALKGLKGKAAFEYKLDGARVQIHKSADTVKIFSRRLSDVTESFPEVVVLVREQVKAEEAILEGEIIAIGEDDHPLPFQHLMRRFRRVHNVEEMITRIPVQLHLFDLLYVNGHSLITEAYQVRRTRLAGISGDIPLTPQLITAEASEAEQFLKDAINRGHEGLIAKKFDSSYTPGIRGKRWFKIKEALEPLDLVIVAAEYGYGRRHKWLSDYYLAARDPDRREYLVLGKTFKGLTDDEIITMTRRLKELAIEQKHGKVVVTPKIVVEIAYNEIQKSPKYKSGMALRFARITRIRDDKSPDEADTIHRVRQIYEQQFEKKARYP